MKFDIRGRLLLLAVLIAGSATASTLGYEELIGGAREAAQRLTQQLAAELRREHEMSGTVRSVAVCKYLAPELSSAISRESGAQVRRVSLKVRNPGLGTPDAWEQTVLLDFERRLALGDAVERIEYAEIVKEPLGNSFRYMKAIPAGQSCLACHGPVEAITPTTSAQIAAEYPHDLAVGHVVGSIRGAVSFKKPLY